MQAYKYNFTGVNLCENPSPPYETNNSTSLFITSYTKSGKTILRGKFVAFHDLIGYFWKYKVGVKKSGTVKNFYNFEKVDCRNILPKLVLGLSRVMYDQTTCVIFKGQYSFDNVDIIKMDRAVFGFPIRMIGENILEFSLVGPHGTGYCVIVNVEFSM